jgi:hypothetical protein
MYVLLRTMATPTQLYAQEPTEVPCEVAGNWQLLDELDVIIAQGLTTLIDGVPVAVVNPPYGGAHRLALPDGQLRFAPTVRRGTPTPEIVLSSRHIPAGDLAHVRFINPGGGTLNWVLFRFSQVAQRGETPELRAALAPGRYRVTAVTPLGGMATATFFVGDDPPDGAPSPDVRTLVKRGRTHDGVALTLGPAPLTDRGEVVAHVRAYAIPPPDATHATCVPAPGSRLDPRLHLYLHGGTDRAAWDGQQAVRITRDVRGGWTYDITLVATPHATSHGPCETRPIITFWRDAGALFRHEPRVSAAGDGPRQLRLSVLPARIQLAEDDTWYDVPLPTRLTGDVALDDGVTALEINYGQRRLARATVLAWRNARPRHVRRIDGALYVFIAGGLTPAGATLRVTLFDDAGRRVVLTGVLTTTTCAAPDQHLLCGAINLPVPLNLTSAGLAAEVEVNR